MGKAAFCNDSGVQRVPGSRTCCTLDRKDGPMPPCRLCESSSDADPTRLPLLCVGTEVRIILDLYYILKFMFRASHVAQW